MIQEKIEKIKDSWDKKNTVFINDISKSFEKINNRGKYYPRYHQKHTFSEQYNLKMENSPKKHPAPNHYFKVKSEKDKTIEDDENKNYYMDRKKCDNRLYKKYRSYIF